MKKLIKSGLLTSLAATVFARTPEKGRLMIEVHVYNYAGVSTEALARAEQETARIYQGAESRWSGGTVR